MARTFVVVLILSSIIATSYAQACLIPEAKPVPIWAGPSSGTPACKPGFYCPNLVEADNSTWPYICPPTTACAVKRLAGTWCDPQGTMEPTICKEGFYCPPPGVTKVKCPSGHFCPFGSYKPIECPWLSLCSEGASEPRHLGAVMVMVLVDIAVAIAVISYYYYRKFKHAEYFSILSGTSRDNHSSSGKKGDKATTELDSLESGMRTLAQGAKASTQVLIEGFHLSRGNQPLLDFDFSELGLKLPGGKRVLNGVSGMIRHGQVTAVMGPSGAGKTTFLNTLMGKVDSSWKTEGSLKVNGVEAKGLSKLKKLIGYVPQEDVMLRELTVWQNLQYSADIRLPREWDSDQRKRHVNAVLETLDLSGVRNSPIGDESTRGISGGQRKRVNIGLELAACPLALFCDEPTSGLDSTASLAVVKAVKSVARTTGMTVVMVIHQPRVEIWNSLDRVLILAPGGITTYLGEQRFVNAYFSHHFNVTFESTDNPADVVMDYIAKFGSECATAWKSVGEAWLAEYAAARRSDDEFDDALAESVSMSLNQAKLMKQGNKLGTSSNSVPPATTMARSSDSIRNSKTIGKNDTDTTSSEDSEIEEGEDISSSDAGRHQHASSSKSMESAVNKSISPGQRDFIAESEDSELMEAAENANDHVVRGSTFLWQLWYAFIRSMKQQYETLNSLVLEMGLAVLAGAVIGFSAQMHYRGVAVVPYTPLTPAPEATILPQKHLYISMAVGIAAASAGVKTFGEGMVVYWREASAGHNRVAYYLAQSLSMLPRIILGGIHFTCMFVVLSQSYADFGALLLNITLIFYAVYGLAAIVSMLVPRKDAPLLAAVSCVIAAVLNGYVRTIPVGVSYISYSYWSHEAFFSGETRYYQHVYQTKISTDFFRLKSDRISMDFGLMFAIGAIYRVVSLGLLLFLNRDKQR